MRWMWIDRVVELEPERRMVAVKNISLAEEHLHDHFAADLERGLPAAPVMPASLIIEGMAQTAGILVGHANAFREKVILAKIGSATIERDATPGCTLVYEAEIERLDNAAAATRGTIRLIDHAARLGPHPTGDERGEPIGAVSLMFSHIDKNLAGSSFPEHNFVFGEGFKTLLRTSGITTDESAAHAHHGP
ncbi:MAG: beta-hydroxyacyl-ACP dehydratase [Planctomycetota bacterium]